MRKMLRRIVPFWLRWRLRQARRRLGDHVGRFRFATTREELQRDPYLVCRYELKLVCYAGQEAAFAAKRSNIELAMRSLDGTVVRGGETLSFWKLVGRPTSRRGYAKAAALQEGVLVEDIGGAICFVSTLLYNVMLLSGMRITERSCHSVDTYGEARYFELGRDAAVEYAYRDLRAINDRSAPIMLSAQLDGDVAIVEACAAVEQDVIVDLAVEPAAGTSDGDAFAVSTRRTIVVDGVATAEDVGLSVYRRPRSPVMEAAASIERR